MNAPAHRNRVTILVILAALLILQKGLELHSKLLPAGVVLKLADGTLLETNQITPSQANTGEHLLTGDMLVLIEWRIVRDYDSFRASWDLVRSRLKIPMLVRRGNRNVGLMVEPRILDIFPHPRQKTIVESGGYVLDYLFAFLVLGSGAYVLGARPQRNASRVFLALATAFSFSAGEMPHGMAPAAALLIGALMILARAALPALFTHFFLVYPRSLPAAGRKTLLVLLYVLAVPGLVLRLTDHLAYWMAYLPTPWGALWLPLTVFQTVLCFVLAGCAATYWLLWGNPDEARKVRWMVLAALLGVILPVFVTQVIPEFLPLSGRISALLHFMAAPWQMAFPLMCSYPLVKHQVLNIRWLLREIVRAITSSWSVRFLLLLPAAFVTHSALASGRLAFWHLTTIGVSLILAGWARGIRGDTIDRVFFPSICRLKTGLDELAARLAAGVRPEAISQLLAAEVPGLVGSRNSYIFRRQKAGQDYPMMFASIAGTQLAAVGEADVVVRQNSSLLSLARRAAKAFTLSYERPNDLGNLLPSTERELMFRLGVVLVIPMRNGEDIHGLMALSEKADQEAYSESEKQWLFRLASVAEKTMLLQRNTRADRQEQ